MGERHLACALVLAMGCTFDTSGTGLDRDGGTPDSDAAWLALSCSTRSDYESRGGTAHRYRVVDSGETYDQAYAECARDGAHLVVIDDQDENAHVLSRIDDPVWLGLDDLTTEGTMQWVNGAPLDFSPWQGANPKNNGNEDCVEMLPTSSGDPGQWNDTECARTKDFVCECDPTFAVPPPPSCMTDPDYDDSTLAGRRHSRGSGLSWQEANSRCAQGGAHLVVISDGDENADVSTLVSSGRVWIGYTDAQNEGAFRWVNSAPFGYENWGGGEPSTQGLDGSDEDCVEMRADGFWNDNACQDSRQYLCECDPSGR